MEKPRDKKLPYLKISAEIKQVYWPCNCQTMVGLAVSKVLILCYFMTKRRPEVISLCNKKKLTISYSARMWHFYINIVEKLLEINEHSYQYKNQAWLTNNWLWCDNEDKKLTTITLPFIYLSKSVARH